MNVLFIIGVLVVVLGVLIFVHELGHFMAAKWAGIRVHRFALGMGNPIPWLTTTRGNTEYSICWLPLGGYVKMASREEEATSSALEGAGPPAGAEPVRPDEWYEAKPVWKRVIVILAGVTMNILFAWFLYSTLAYRNGEPIDPETRIGEVFTDSLPPGAEAFASLQPGDTVVAINGRPVDSWTTIFDEILAASGDSLAITVAGGRTVTAPIHAASLKERNQVRMMIQPWDRAVVEYVEKGRPGEQAGLQVGDTIISAGASEVTSVQGLIRRIRGAPGGEVELLLGRADGRHNVTVIPDSVTEGAATVGKIGVAFKPDGVFSVRSLSLLESIGVGGETTLAASTLMVRTVQGLLSARVSTRDVGGPIMIGQEAAKAARAGLDQFLGLLALISMNLAVLNLLPIPILDGGQFVFLLAEGILRRPLPEKIRSAAMLVGLVLIGALMLLAFWNDIARLIGWH